MEGEMGVLSKENKVKWVIVERTDGTKVEISGQSDEFVVLQEKSKGVMCHGSFSLESLLLFMEALRELYIKSLLKVGTLASNKIQ